MQRCHNIMCSCNLEGNDALMPSARPRARRQVVPFCYRARLGGIGNVGAVQHHRDQHGAVLLRAEYAALRRLAAAAVVGAARRVCIVSGACGALDGGRVELVEHLDLRGGPKL